jgi:integrating conjugative element protein (TIGR03765 family)
MRRLTLGLIIAWLSIPVSAQPTVIADFGGRDSGYKNPSVLMQAAAKRLPPAALTAPNNVSINHAQRFPMRSSMQVGLVNNQRHQHPLTTPLFIASNDPVSLHWVDTNRAYLRSINAMGIVTNVDSALELDAMKRRFAELQLVAMPVTSIAQAFSLHHYPVLITAQEIRQ